MESHEKKIRQIDYDYREWITRQPCIICKSPGVLHDDGVYRVTPSHALTQGAGNPDYDNILPHCVLHHRNHETSPKHEKSTWLHLAREYTERYFNETGKRREDESEIFNKQHLLNETKE